MQFFQKIKDAIKIIQKEKYSEIKCEIQNLEIKIDILIEKISEFGSYWMREVPHLNWIYSREEFIHNILSDYLKKCKIDFKQKEPLLELLSRREAIIASIITNYLERCGI